MLQTSSVRNKKKLNLKKKSKKKKLLCQNIKPEKSENKKK